MITSIRSNMGSFREVEFGPNFNVVLADRTKEATKKDSRNGLGKTTLIEIIHFCLGSRTLRNKGLMVSQLEGWSFTLGLKFNGREIFVTRCIDSPSRIDVEDASGVLGGLNERQSRVHSLAIDDFSLKFGDLFFGINEQDPGFKYRPTFRSLLSYFVRRGIESFSSPFSHHSKQREWDKQVNNAYLLGLAWEHASKLQVLKDEEKTLGDLRRAAQKGLLAGMVGTLGNLEAERARLETEAWQHSQNLKSFRVHPQYREIEKEANELTNAIQELNNANLADTRLVDLYQRSLEDNQDPDTEDVHGIYRAVGITMPGLVRRRLSEVREFHRKILTNRRAYLLSEIQRIESNLAKRHLQVQEKTARRAQLLEVLRAHGALDEHTKLQELLLNVVAKLNETDNRINNLKRFEQGRSEVRVKKELLLQSARRDFDERRDAREAAINVFNSNSQSLYSAPGNLVVDVTDSGLKFDVEIMRSGSHGISNMKIFCYDLMLAQTWAAKKPMSGLLIHDSTIFDGVDERQVAQALELAQSEAESRGFQYVCTLNSDTFPFDELSPDFDLDEFVRLRITDESEEGGLLGIRF